MIHGQQNIKFSPDVLANNIQALNLTISDFGGLVVSMLPSGTRVRRFKLGRSRRIFSGEKSLAWLPSEGK
jgi:hypothetical protein